MTDRLSPCTLCPRACRADRHRAPGACGAGEAITVNLHRLHHWEEPPLSGTRGSGTIFFSHCTMRCVYCQNWAISQEGHGTARSVDEVAGLMLELQTLGAHNVNLVTPSHYAPQLAEAIAAARARGLAIPVVWNSNGWELPRTLRLVEGLVDVYLPDFRYAREADAVRYSAAPRYPAVAREAIAEMHRQAGHLVLDEEGIARRGLLVRLLVLPGLGDTLAPVLDWIAAHLGTETHLSLMGQYYPTYRADRFPEINRSLTQEEYDRCLELLEERGFENGFIQDVGSNSAYTPDFHRGAP